MLLYPTVSAKCKGGRLESWGTPLSWGSHSHPRTLRGVQIVALFGPLDLKQSRTHLTRNPFLTKCWVLIITSILKTSGNHKHLKDLRWFSDTLREILLFESRFYLPPFKTTEQPTHVHHCQHLACFFLPTQLCWPGFLHGGLEQRTSEVSGSAWSLAVGLTNNSWGLEVMLPNPVPGFDRWAFELSFDVKAQL